MTKGIADYEKRIKELHQQLIDDPDSDKLQKQLYRQVGPWVNMLNIAVRVASNEKNPWNEAELGTITIPMSKKTETGHSQVGDYHFEVLNSNQDIILGRLVIERKEISDLYNTLMNEDKRSRFKREVERYRADSRFDSMIIMVEGSITDFENYVPEVYVCRLDQIPGLGAHRLAAYLKKYYKTEDIDPHKVFRSVDGTLIWVDTDTHNISIEHSGIHQMRLRIDGVLRDTLYIKKLYGKPALYQMKGASDESKIATIARLFTKSTPVSWCDSREMAIKLYRQMIRQWCIENYNKIIKL